MKGGTALKKCYFGDYRFSEDLDFSALDGAPRGRAMERLVGEACESASRLLDQYAPVVFACERYTEKSPHPGSQPGGLRDQSQESFFDERMLPYVEETWEQSLGPLVPGLPSFQTVTGALRPAVAALVSFGG